MNRLKAECLDFLSNTLAQVNLFSLVFLPPSIGIEIEMKIMCRMEDRILLRKVTCTMFKNSLWTNGARSVVLLRISHFNIVCLCAECQIGKYAVLCQQHGAPQKIDEQWNDGICMSVYACTDTDRVSNFHRNGKKNNTTETEIDSKPTKRHTHNRKKIKI